MIRILLAVLIIFGSTSLFAQELSKKEEKAINKRIATYIKLTKKEDYNSSMDLVFPKVFEIASKEQMVEAFTGLEAQGFDMIFEEMSVKQIQPILFTNSAKYVICPYDMSIKFLILDEDKQTSQIAENLLTRFKASYITGQVTLNIEEYSFKIEGKKYLMAIQDDQYGKDWYFLDFDQNNIETLTMLFPEEVVNKTKALIKD